MERCVQESVEAVLATAQWDEKLVPQWINDICEKSMKQLMELNRPYKFVGKPSFSPNNTTQSLACSCRRRNSLARKRSCHAPGRIARMVRLLRKISLLGSYQIIYPPQRAKDSA